MSVLDRIKQAVSNGRARCFVPGCRFNNHRLHRHINRSHPVYCSESCPNCPAKFVAKLDLSNHQRDGCPTRYKHTNVSRAKLNDKCENCQKSFGSKKALKQHQRDKHNGSTKNSQNENLQHCEKFDDLVDFSSKSKAHLSMKNLQLNKSYRKKLLKAVDAMCSILKKHIKDFDTYSMKTFVKGGSLGKGTAVKGYSDIDCVIFFNNLKTMQVHKDNLEKSKKNIRSCLEKYCGSENMSLDNWEETPFAVKAKVTLKNYPDESFDVDLLPTFNADIETKNGLKNLYDEILNSENTDRQFYSAAFVKLQRQFVKVQPANVKDLIRMVKVWKKISLNDAGEDGNLRIPSSYPLELITIHCWEKAKKPKKFDRRLGFKAVLECLVNYGAIDAVWKTNYDEELVNRAKMSIDKSSPFVLDPANPVNNVCSASCHAGWEKVADAARNMLQNRHLRSLNSENNNPWVLAG